jgi:hypothetical protein
MSLSQYFGWHSNTVSDELPDIFPIDITRTNFVQADTLAIYYKILADVFERTHGIPEKAMPLLWDNCLQSETNKGLVTLLAEAMTDKKDLFLVYDKSLGTLRLATSDEQRQIREDYKNRAESKIGVYVSFSKYTRTDMVRLYSALEYATVAGMYKTANLSKAIQIKIEALRSSVGLNDSAIARAQAATVAKSLGAGRDVVLDAKDIIETALPQTKPASDSMNLFNQKRAFYLGLPASYITGEAPAGLGDSGLAEARAIDRGLKIYYFSIVKPTSSKKSPRPRHLK